LLFETLKIPQVRKIPALLRLHWLNRAIVAFEKNTFIICFLLQCQSASIPAQSRVLLNELMLAHSFERRQPRDFSLRKSDLSRPPATRCASLTFVENRHLPTLAAPSAALNVIQK
jgi:hypothetical protein